MAELREQLPRLRLTTLYHVLKKIDKQEERP